MIDLAVFTWNTYEYEYPFPHRSVIFVNWSPVFAALLGPGFAASITQSQLDNAGKARGVLNCMLLASECRGLTTDKEREVRNGIE